MNEFSLGGSKIADKMRFCGFALFNMRDYNTIRDFDKKCVY